MIADEIHSMSNQENAGDDARAEHSSFYRASEARSFHALSDLLHRNYRGGCLVIVLRAASL